MLDVIGGALMLVVGIVVLFLSISRMPKRERPPKIVKPPPLPLTFDALDALDEQERQANEKRRKLLRPFGVFGRLVTYAVLFLLLYAYWPPDISHKPFASLTLSDVFGTVFAIVFGFTLLGGLLNPSEFDEIRNAWGWVGVWIAVLAGAAAFIFLLQTAPKAFA